MKKSFALFFIATMLIFTGCGNTMDGAKKDVQETQQKVEQKVDEAKNKAEEVKKDAETKIDSMKAETADKIAENVPTMNNSAEKFAIGGIFPGMNFDEAKKILGEPSGQDDDEFFFSNGITLEISSNTVEEIKINQVGAKTAAGIAVGMTEQDIINAYGEGLKEIDDGMTEYKYFSKDNHIELKFSVQNGNIIEIKSSYHD